MQNRFRKGDHIAKENVKKLLPLFDEKDELLPVIRITLHMTHLLLNPCWGSAWHVLYVAFTQTPYLTLTMMQRGCSKLWWHPRLHNAPLGLPCWHGPHPKHARNLWRQSHPTLLECAPRARALLLEMAQFCRPLCVAGRPNATNEDKI
jgi:hypothetical protein